MTHQLMVILVIQLALGAVACKGEKETKPDPKTLTELDQCKKNLADKDKLIKAVEEENARLLREKGTSGEIVIAIEGNALTIKAGASGSPPPIDDKAAALASKDFLDVVAKSRGAIQKCYEQALKKNTALQARTVTLHVSASFAQSGTYRDSQFSPSLGETFDACMKTVAGKWKLQTNTPAMSFKAQVSLTPS